MKGIDNLDFAGGVMRLMQRELAELKEMVRLGAGILGDEQRIEMIKGLEHVAATLIDGARREIDMAKKMVKSARPRPVPTPPSHVFQRFPRSQRQWLLKFRVPRVVHAELPPLSRRCAVHCPSLSSLCPPFRSPIMPLVCRALASQQDLIRFHRNGAA
jgi:hypothetical protein